MARVGRLVPALVLLLLVSTVHSKAENGRAETDYLVIITLGSAVYGYIHWMVTRWRFEGDTLRIETGLIRKDSRRLPLARIQAVDIVRPLLARLLGVSELRIRLAGSGATDGKLAYLAEAQAAELRLVLLAGHIDTEAAVSSNTGLPMASVDTGRLLGSVFLSLITIVLIGTVAALAVLDQFEPKTAAGAAGVLAVYLLSAAGVIWRRLSGQYAFIAVEAPEGVRIRRGLLQTISETVPYGRIQAVRQVEPLLWRPFGWCRLEVDVAGSTARNQRGEGTSVVRKALLPVGSQQDSWHLLARLLGAPDPVRTAPPAAGPAEGPAELPLPLGRPRRRPCRLRDRPDQPEDDLGAAGEDTEHPPGPGPAAATARHWPPSTSMSPGKRARAEFRDREVGEADELVAELTALSRSARQRDRTVPPAPGSDAVPSGWYPDPAGRHEQRYWHEGRWTEHVANGGRRSSDAATPAP